MCVHAPGCMYVRVCVQTVIFVSDTLSLSLNIQGSTSINSLMKLLYHVLWKICWWHILLLFFSIWTFLSMLLGCEIPESQFLFSYFRRIFPHCLLVSKLSDKKSAAFKTLLFCVIFFSYFIFIFLQFDYDVSGCGFLKVHLLGLASFLAPANLYL